MGKSSLISVVLFCFFFFRNIKFSSKGQPSFISIYCLMSRENEGYSYSFSPLLFKHCLSPKVCAVVINIFVGENNVSDLSFGNKNCRKSATEIRWSVLTNLVTNPISDTKCTFFLHTTFETLIPKMWCRSTCDYLPKSASLPLKKRVSLPLECIYVLGVLFL